MRKKLLVEILKLQFVNFIILGKMLTDTPVKMEFILLFDIIGTRIYIASVVGEFVTFPSAHAISWREQRYRKLNFCTPLSTY